MRHSWSVSFVPLIVCYLPLPRNCSLLLAFACWLSYEFWKIQRLVRFNQNLVQIAQVNLGDFYFISFFFCFLFLMTLLTFLTKILESLTCQIYGLDSAGLF